MATTSTTPADRQAEPAGYEVIKSTTIDYPGSSPEFDVVRASPNGSMFCTIVATCYDEATAVRVARLLTTDDAHEAHLKQLDTERAARFDGGA